MSVIKDVDHTLQQTTKIRSLHEHKLDSESLNKLAQNIKSYSYSAAVEAVNSMNRELKDLYEKYLELGVRSHLLEVDLATQFSPDLVIAVEELNESCAACSLAVENLTHCSESAEMLDETCQDNNVCEDN